MHILFYVRLRSEKCVSHENSDLNLQFKLIGYYDCDIQTKVLGPT